MPENINRIKQLVDKNMVVEAVELPPNHHSKDNLVNHIEEVLQNFDDDMNYAHFVVRVKRSEKPIILKSQVQHENTDNGFSIDDLVNETLALNDEISESRAKNGNKQEQADYDPDFLLKNAGILEANKDFDLARNIYRELIRRGKQVKEAYLGLASTNEKQGNFDEAIRCYEEALAYDSNPDIYQTLTALQIKAGKDKDACDTLKRALTVPGLTDHQRFEFHKSLGNCFTRVGDHVNAETHYMGAYEINSDSDSLQVNVGTLALQKNEYTTAKKHFERALELNSKNGKALCGLGIIDLEQGTAANAFDNFVECLGIEPMNLSALYNLVKCAYELKRFKEAAKFLSHYIENSQPNLNILYSYAGILYHQEEYQRALSEVEKILRLHPEHTGTKQLKALIQQKI